MTNEEVKNVLLSNNSFLIKNDFSGWDPYDLQQLSIYKWALSRGSKSIAKNNWSFGASIVRKAFFAAEQFAPLLLRRQFKVEKQINYKALGLIGSSFLVQHKIFKDDSVISLINALISQLLTNDFSKYPGKHWGYPFDWQSSIFIPRGTPSGVVTSTVGNFFIDYKEKFHTDIYDEIIDQIAVFFLKGLNISYYNGDERCFSYTPLDDYKVHNASLMIAEYLIRAGILFNNPDYIQKGKEAVNFSVRRINEDGSIYYGDNSYSRSVDNYHTGFVIRSLFRINHLLPEISLQKHIDQLFRYYLENLFYKRKYPKFFNNSLNPIDIHSISESILTLSLFADNNPLASEILENILTFAVDEMYDRKYGTFYYRSYITENGNPVFKVKIPYMRWGQAWMNYALAKYLTGKENNE